MAQIQTIFAGQLSDGRLQLFGAPSWTCWKLSVDPNSGWSEWSRFDLGSFDRIWDGATARLSNGELQLFVKAFEFNSEEHPGGPDCATTWKVDPNSTAAWAPWNILLRGTYSNGPVGSETVGVRSVAAGPLADGRPQVFMEEIGPNVSRLMTTWKETADADASWVDVQPLNPQPPETLDFLTAGQLSDGRLQLWGVGTNSGGIWSTWKDIPDPDSDWQKWSPFQSIGSGYNVIFAMCVGRLPDGRLQLWAYASNADHSGLFSCWKTTTDANSPWTPWEQFFDTEQFVSSLTVAPLSDGRLQLWALDITEGTLFSTWKLTKDPDSAWAPWSPFPTPTG